MGANHEGQTNVPSGLTRVKAIAAGSVFSLALKDDGTVVQWPEAQPSRPWHAPPPGLSGVVAIDAEASQRVALKEDGSVVAWGNDNSTGATDVPPGLTDVVDVAAGAEFSVALKDDGTVVAWGYNGGGRTNVPAGLTGVVDISAGFSHSLALVVDNATPAARDDGPYQAGEDATLNVSSQDGVLANDSDTDGNDLTAQLVDDVDNGTLTLNPDGSFAYAPNGGFRGDDSFTYKASDGLHKSRRATATINVNEVNDAPGFTKGADQTVDEDAGAQSVPGWATNISAGPSDESGQTVTFDVTNDNNALFISGGQPAVSSDGTLTYTPAADANGTATVSVKARDDGGTSNGGVDTSAEQTFRITINPVEDGPACDGRAATIHVSDGRIVGGPDDGERYRGVLRGTSRADVIVGTGGTDAIAGGGGDVICSGGGRDAISGGGRDTLRGGDDTDAISGDAGDDRLFGEGGRDYLYGRDGDDTLEGGSEADRFDGGRGTDTAPDFNAGEGDTRTNIP